MYHFGHSDLKNKINFKIFDTEDIENMHDIVSRGNPDEEHIFKCKFSLLTMFSASGDRNSTSVEIFSHCH